MIKEEKNLETFKYVEFSGLQKTFKNLKFGLFRFLRFFKKTKKPSFYNPPLTALQPCFYKLHCSHLSLHFVAKCGTDVDTDGRM